MIKKMLKRLVNDAVDYREREMKDNMTKEIRRITEDVVREMMIELLSSNKDTETLRFFYGEVKRDTLVGTLKNGIKDKVLSQMTKEEKERVLKYVDREEFIDSVVNRIQRKQLTRSEI